MKIIDIILIGLMILLIFSIGFMTNDILEQRNIKKSVDGFYAERYNDSMLDNIKNSYNEYGNWICVDVSYMTFERAKEVCNHEVGHEIFAEYCENNIDKCIEVTNE